MKKAYQKIITISLSVVLVLVGSVSSYASSGSPDPEEVTSWLAPDLASSEAKELSEEIYPVLNGDVKASSAAAATYTIDDLYNLLYAALRGNSYTSSYSLPLMANMISRISQILYGSGQAVPSSSLYYVIGLMGNRIEAIKGALIDGDSSQIPVGPGIRESLYGVDRDTLDWITLFDLNYRMSDSLDNLESYINYIRSDLGYSNSYLSSISQSLNSYNWLSAPYTYLGKSLGFDTNYISGSASGTNFKFRFSPTYPPNTQTISNSPLILRVFVPYEADAYAGTVPQYLKSIHTSQGGDKVVSFDANNVFYEATVNGTYIYLIDFRVGAVWGDYIFEVASPYSYSVNSTSGSISYIPFNTDSYQQIKQAFYSKSSLDLLTSISDSVYNPSIKAAEEASQPVIDDTLSGFTGNGSAAANTSDTGGMKSMSGSIRSGLDAGGSVGNATSVFSTGSGFWGWFSVENSNAINSPYPAPVVTPSRSNDSGDIVLDFLSGNQAELQELLGGIK